MAKENAKHTAEELKQYQALPLDLKVELTRTRIQDWCRQFGGDVCVSFSGGKDSTVLLHLVRSYYPNVRAVFSDTGLEYPEIRKFAMSFDNVDVVRPRMRFDEVISTYGYPLIGKEVAEAIYYARRIRSHSVNVERERERERKRVELHGESKRNSWETGRVQTHRDGGGRTKGKRELYRRTQFRRHAGVKQIGATQEGDTFSNPDVQFGEKSIYNKEKYLPIARDLPVPISHYCCMKMKKEPMKKYQRSNHVYPFLGNLAEESRIRRQAWIRHGCNAYESTNPTSQPLSFWTEQDILKYIVQNGIEICSVYGDIVSVDGDGIEYPPVDLAGQITQKLKCTGCDRTGCVYCAFGFHNEKGKTRFQRLAETHPKLYEYSIGGGQWADNPAYDPTAPKMDGTWQNWNPKKIWVPSKKGLGMGKVFDMVNEIYGKNFYRYE